MQNEKVRGYWNWIGWILPLVVIPCQTDVPGTTRGRGGHSSRRMGKRMARRDMMENAVEKVNLLQRLLIPERRKAEGNTNSDFEKKPRKTKDKPYKLHS